MLQPPCERGDSCPMPLGFEHVHPVGMIENSRAFQRWDCDLVALSPVGTTEAAAFLPSLRGLSREALKPSVETLGYFRLSLRDRAAGLVSQILVALERNVRSDRRTATGSDSRLCCRKPVD